MFVRYANMRSAIEWLLVNRFSGSARRPRGAIRAFSGALVLLAMSHLQCAGANQINVKIPTPSYESQTAFVFIPAATLVGFGFVGVCILLLAIAKIMFTSSAQYMTNNRYDLVIFKPPTKNSSGVPRRNYANTAANAQNLKAASNCGFDLSMLTTRNPFTALTSLSSIQQKL